jgi:hypothetical protein
MIDAKRKWAAWGSPKATKSEKAIAKRALSLDPEGRVRKGVLDPLALHDVELFELSRDGLDDDSLAILEDLETLPDKRRAAVAAAYHGF